MLGNPAASDRGRIFVAGHPRFASAATGICESSDGIYESRRCFLQNDF